MLTVGDTETPSGAFGGGKTRECLTRCVLHFPRMFLAAEAWPASCPLGLWFSAPEQACVWQETAGERGAAQGGLKVNGLVEESVAEENHQGEETELEVAGREQRL